MAGSAIEAQLREHTYASELELAEKKVNSYKDRIKVLAEEVVTHFTHHARYIFLKDEMKKVLLAVHHDDEAMAQNAYKEINRRVHAKALEKYHEFKAIQKEKQKDFDDNEAVVAAQHRADSAQAALKLRDTLANELSIEAQKRATEVGKQVRKRGREEVDLMNECLANTQKVQTRARTNERREGVGACAQILESRTSTD